MARRADASTLRRERALFARRREAGVLVPAEDSANLPRFTQEYAFDSPSGAAAAVSGTGLNGRIAWKVKGEGTTYTEVAGKGSRPAGPSMMR